MTKDNAHPLVSICCITYNHEKYIKDALSGFLMQKTDFPVEVVIGEDCSTDDTRNILNEHKEMFDGKLTLHLNDQNLGVIGNLIFTLSACKGKYIAICEGDDYWTDPLKLQKQVDFMEAHPECSISCHKVLHRYQDFEEKNHLFPDLDGDHTFTLEEMFHQYISSTCSLMFRNIDFEEYSRYINGFWIGDIPLIFFYLKRGKMGYIDQVMGTYRKNQESFMYPNYSGYRFPFLFDTYTKIRKRLKIFDSDGLDAQISFYGDEMLKKHFRENDFKKMRQIALKYFPSVHGASPARYRRFWIFSLFAFCSPIYYVYKAIRKDAFNTYLE